MAGVIESVSTNAMGTGGVLTKPTGLAVGDTMIAIVVAETATNLASPAGWTLIGAAELATYAKTKSFYKVADSSDVSASNFTFTGTDIRGGILYRISGAAPANIIFGAGTPPSSSSVIISYFFAGDNAARTVTWSSYTVTGGDSPTFTERLDSSEATGLSTCLAVADAIYNSSSAITACGSTISGSIDESGGAFIIIPSQQDGSATSTLLDVTPTILTGQTGSNTTTATSTLLEVSPALVSPNAKSSSDRTQWTNETKPASTTWTNQTK